MSPIQQMLLGVGAVATKTYVDDVFSTFLYKGNNNSNPNTQSINNGIDLGTEGGLVWIKSRTNTYNHILQDSVNGTGKWLQSNTNGGTTNTNQYITSFNANGFSLGTDNDINNSSQDFSSWTFRKAPGFFDVVTWTGNGAGSRQISHSLESVPGCIMIKRTDDSYGWYVYHRGLDSSNPERYYLRLNESSAATNTTGQQWMAAAPTATNFTLAADIGGSGYEGLNTNGQTYVAYVFAGGESTAATARSVDFDGSGDYLSIPDSSDFNIGSSEFTIEGWIKVDALNSTGAGWLTSWSSSSQRGWYFGTSNTNKFVFAWSDTGSNINTIDSGYTVKVDGQFHHYAVTRSGTTLYFYVDGLLVKINTSSGDTFHNSTGPVAVGYNPDGGSGWELNGKISNLRFVKGTVVYTSSFRPPTEPLTNITNTKLLCCNNSSTTGSTVTPGTITANGDPTASTDSPFDDPAGFVFGDAGDQNVIKCGSYTGSSGTEPVNLGFEPQWVMIKAAGSTGDSWSNWHIYDNMRGVVTGGNDRSLSANTNDAEESGTNHANSNLIDFTSTGFIADASGGGASVNGVNGVQYIYIAIRRPDGYVGKLPELGTDVFAMDTGGGTPDFDSGFPVDFATFRFPAQSSSWYTGARLIQDKYLLTDSNAAEVSSTDFAFDYNDGWSNGSWGATLQSWMWKRHAGFDVVAYQGGEVSTNDRVISHSLGKIPEMIWVKNRTIDYSWDVYHKGMNGGTNPWNYGMHLNEDGAESADSSVWNNTAPTSVGFTVGSSHTVNRDGSNHIAMLFASISGISAVGSYTGNGSSSGPTITTGFTPRFILIKSVSAESWYVLDTLRGLGTSSDKLLRPDKSNAELAQTLNVTTSSTGFTIIRDWAPINQNNTTMLYYAHA